MSQKFNWRAEDDEKWEAVDDRNEPGGSTRSARRRWLFVGVAVLLFLSVGLLSFRQIDRYLDDTGVEAEQGVLSSNDLVLAAARNGDREILATLLSASEPAWADGQLLLLESGLMFDRSPFGIEWRHEQLPVFKVIVTPRIDSAEVIVGLDYTYPLGRDPSETVTLEHSLHYRQSNNRWLLSPPDRDYWGSANSEEGYYLNLGFSGRDSTIGRRLATDLEGVLAALCNLDDTDLCSTGFPMQVRLVADPTSIVQFSEPDSRLVGTLDLELPTPSLFGLPADEAAYQAIYRSYAERLVAAVTANQIGWHCCGQNALYQALLDLQLTRLALISWPLTAEHYRLALNEPLIFGNLLWVAQNPSDHRLGSKEVILAYLLIEYLDTEWGAVTASELQRNLLSANSFDEWLEMAIQPSTKAAFVDGWHSFLSDRLDYLEN